MEENYKLLKKIYFCTEKNSQTLNTLLPHISKAQFRKDLLLQINCYDKINHDAKNEIYNLGKTVSKSVVLEKLNEFCTLLNTSGDKSQECIANLIIEMSDKTILEITKAKNSYKEFNPTYYNIARNLINSEYKNIETIKTYL